MGEASVLATPHYRAAGTGPATWAMGSLYEHLARAADIGGALDVALVTQPPGIATPLHRHTNEAEAFFLVDGQMTYRAGEEEFRLTPGDFIWLPIGVPHAFRITGTTPCRFLALASPGGLMTLYDEVGIPAAERRLPGSDGQSIEVEIPKWNHVGRRFGVEVTGPPIPE